MTNSEKRLIFLRFFGLMEADFTATVEKNLIGSIHEALYTANELSLWPDDVGVSAEQAIMCWAIVEKLSKESFPKELCM